MPDFHMTRLTVLLRAIAVGLCPALVACTQTTQTPPPPEPAVPTGSGVVAAITDAERTRAAHQASSTAMNIATSFDPTGLSGYAIQAAEEAQERELEEKYRRIDEEIDKTLARAEAAQALGEDIDGGAQETSGQPAARRSKRW